MGVYDASEIAINDGFFNSTKGIQWNRASKLIKTYILVIHKWEDDRYEIQQQSSDYYRWCKWHW